MIGKKVNRFKTDSKSFKLFKKSQNITVFL